MVQINSDNDNDNKGSSKNDNNIKIDDALNLVAAHELSLLWPNECCLHPTNNFLQKYSFDHFVSGVRINAND